ncbi:hypothetical protein [Sabulicella rubraurantiaca]|uniref:hypothetical protein n=1 Tax=Sabulicella rubraurantiaca TaxID=2811429 RepID=UPI001A968050|nr:hypothetical protein [Sabulicella rubraurantiaca]
MPAISAGMTRFARILPLLAALASTSAAAQDIPRVRGSCGLDGRLLLDRVQAERRSDGQWGYLIHIRNTTRRPILFTMSLRAAERELARRDNQPYRVGGNEVLVVPAGPGLRPVPTAEVAAGLTLNCPM